MKKASIIARKAIVFATGKAITLLGIVVSLNSCLMKYGSPPPQPPKYWSDREPEMVKIRAQAAEQLDALPADDARLQEIEERLDVIRRLKHRYGGSEEIAKITREKIK